MDRYLYWPADACGQVPKPGGHHNSLTMAVECYAGLEFQRAVLGPNASLIWDRSSLPALAFVGDANVTVTPVGEQLAYFRPGSRRHGVVMGIERSAIVSRKRIGPPPTALLHQALRNFAPLPWPVWALWLLSVLTLRRLGRVRGDRATYRLLESLLYLAMTAAYSIFLQAALIAPNYSQPLATSIPELLGMIRRNEARWVLDSIGGEAEVRAQPLLVDTLGTPLRVDYVNNACLRMLEDDSLVVVTTIPRFYMYCEASCLQVSPLSVLLDSQPRLASYWTDDDGSLGQERRDYAGMLVDFLRTHVTYLANMDKRYFLGFRRQCLPPTNDEDSLRSGATRAVNAALISLTAFLSITVFVFAAERLCSWRHRASFQLV